MRSFVKDTTYFVKKVQPIGQVPNNTLLVTLDVVSLYTNIPHQQALAIISRLLHAKRPAYLKPSNQDLTRLLALVLSLNHFELNNTFWTQRGGVAMGSKVSPTVANLSVEDFENKYVYSYHLQPLIWLRFIDNIFLVWSHSKEELDLFIQHLNESHPTFKFTANIHHQSMDFLGTTVKVDMDGSLYTTIFTKPTDTHTYLRYTSAHPPHQKKSGPYSQLVKVKCICTKQSNYDFYSENILDYYTHRGYPDSVIASARQKASTLDRATLLVDWSLNNQITQPTNNDNLHVIITYNPANPDVKATLDRFWPILNSSKYLEAIHHKKVVIGHGQNTNLRDILVKARIRYPSTERLN